MSKTPMLSKQRMVGAVVEAAMSPGMGYVLGMLTGFYISKLDPERATQLRNTMENELGAVLGQTGEQVEAGIMQQVLAAMGKSDV